MADVELVLESTTKVELTTELEERTLEDEEREDEIEKVDVEDNVELDTPEELKGIVDVVLLTFELDREDDKFVTLLLLELSVLLVLLLVFELEALLVLTLLVVVAFKLEGDEVVDDLTLETLLLVVALLEESNEEVLTVEVVLTLKLEEDVDASVYIKLLVSPLLVEMEDMPLKRPLKTKWMLLRCS